MKRQVTRDGRQEERRKQIEDAAYALLAERGFAATSMLEIARRAKASNETLYNWYGDKLGLFAAMVESNSERAKAILEDALKGRSDLETSLTEFGSVLLMAILSERAVSLNRVAAADVSGTLGRALASGGRDRIVPMLAGRFAALGPHPCFETAEEMAETFVKLLVGDMQIRRVIRTLAEPDEAFCRAMARDAVGRFLSLVHADGTHGG